LVDGGLFEIKAAASYVKCSQSTGGYLFDIAHLCGAVLSIVP
jgi:hypothetical protein